MVICKNNINCLRLNELGKYKRLISESTGVKVILRDFWQKLMVSWDFFSINYKNQDNWNIYGKLLLNKNKSLFLNQPSGFKTVCQGWL